MFEHLRRIAKKLDVEVQPGTAENAKGEKFEITLLKHGAHVIAALERKQYTTLLYPIDFSPQESDLLASQPEEIQTRLIGILRREMLEGRSGFNMLFDETKKPPRLRRITIEQKLVIQDEGPETTQRVADAIQELVVVGMRCGDALGLAYQDLRSARQGSADTYHAGMYA